MVDDEQSQYNLVADDIKYNKVTLVHYRYCQRMWVATLRSICKPCSLLCFKNSNCYHIGFLG